MADSCEWCVMSITLFQAIADRGVDFGQLCGHAVHLKRMSESSYRCNFMPKFAHSTIDAGPVWCQARMRLASSDLLRGSVYGASIRSPFIL